MLRRQQGQSGSETMLVISVVVLATVAASSTLIPLFSSGVDDLGGDVKAILESGSVAGSGGPTRDGANPNAPLPGTDPTAGPEDRSNANRMMNPDSQVPGDATGQAAPREHPRDREDRQRIERRTGNRYDNIGQLDQQA